MLLNFEDKNYVFVSFRALLLTFDKTAPLVCSEKIKLGKKKTIVENSPCGLTLSSSRCPRPCLCRPWRALPTSDDGRATSRGRRALHGEHPSCRKRGFNTSLSAEPHRWHFGTWRTPGRRWQNGMSGRSQHACSVDVRFNGDGESDWLASAHLSLCSLRLNHLDATHSSH